MRTRTKVIDTIVIALLLIFVLAMGLAYAQNDSSIDTNTKNKLEKIEQKLATDSGKPKINLKIKKGRHIVGVLTSVNETTLLVTTAQGLKTIFTDSSTKFIAVNPKGEVKLTDLKAGDRLAIYGVDSSDGSGLASLVARLASKGPARHALFGRISSIAGTSLVLNHIVADDKILGTINTTADTVTKSKNATITFAQLKVGDVVAASGTLDDKGVLTAKLIHIIPGLGLKSPTATSSATP